MFVEAPVGTGKTIGALMPSLIFNKYKHKNIVYATATHNLQDQMFKDNGEISIMEQVSLLKNNDSILAKGLSNYACKKKFENNIDKFNNEEIINLKKFFNNAKYGSRDELYNSFNLKLSSKKWNLISIRNNAIMTSDFNCPGHRYISQFNLPHTITVTNQSQYINSFMKYESNKSGTVPVNTGIVIFDESHKLEENYLSACDNEISVKSLEHFAKSKKARSFYQKIKNKFSKIKNNSYSDKEKPKIDKELENLIKGFAYNMGDSYNSNIEDESFELSTKLNKINNGSTTSWVSFDTNGYYLHIVDNDFIFKYRNFIKNVSKKNKLIIMSGTITSTKNGINELKNRLSLTDDDFIYKKYPNTFDLANQTYLCIPKGLPKPSNDNDNHLNHVEKLAVQLSKSINNKGLLILCTSYNYVNNIYDYLSKNVKNRKILKQDNTPVSVISNEFSNDTSSILVGSGSFFTGFSVKGKSLCGILISKLPYPVPDDPMLTLKKKVYGNNSKIEYSMMLRQLEQGMGRLIRDANDSGIIEISDSRILKSPSILRWLKNKGYTIHNDLHHFKCFNTKHKTNKTSYCKVTEPKVIFQHSINDFVKLPSTKKPKKYHTLDEAQKWSRSYIRQIRKKYPNYPKIKTSYKGFRECYQSILDMRYSIPELHNDYRNIPSDFPFANKNQKIIFKKMTQSRNAIAPVKTNKII